MKTVSSAVIFLSVVSASLAAVGIGPAVVHERHPNKCYNDESDSYFSPGEFWSLEGCGRATCTKYSTSKLMISYESCGIAVVQPPCVLVQDNSKPYPACCHKVVCPEYNDEDMDMYGSSEETVSGRKNYSSASSSSMNGRAGSAVHFSLAEDEENAVDRSEDNNLQSLEEDEQDTQNSIEDDESSYEMVQPRRIPFRFQFAHLYDIGRDHEHRLNDVDAQEDYQLV